MPPRHRLQKDYMHALSLSDLQDNLSHYQGTTIIKGLLMVWRSTDSSQELNSQSLPQLRGVVDGLANSAEFSLLDLVCKQRRHNDVYGYQRTRFTSKLFSNGKSSSFQKENVTDLWQLRFDTSVKTWLALLTSLLLLITWQGTPLSSVKLHVPVYQCQLTYLCTRVYLTYATYIMQLPKA